MCLVVLALGKLGAIPGNQEGWCRLPYQLSQAAAEAAPRPGFSPCLQCLGASARETPSLFLSFPLGFSSSLD